ncbi:hypothetical protein HYX13_05555 [Candidatus Woesearchaeota archaeon]|nr:hypothetical protein [Candidatus Woesearchaeota archaeon]
MNLPTEPECMDYFEQYVVPKNIFHHCLKVREVSFFLAQQLLQKKVQVNVHFVNCLALFHDMFKVVTLKELAPNKFHKYQFTEKEKEMWKKLREQYPNLYEGDVANLILKDKYPELAFSLTRVSNPHAENLSWEESIVHYADWRVFQEKIVPLQERLVYLRERYPRSDDAWMKYAQKIKEQEEKIFSRLSLTPEELAEKIKK